MLQSASEPPPHNAAPTVEAASPLPPAYPMLERPPPDDDPDGTFRALLDELDPSLSGGDDGEIPIPFIEHQLAQCFDAMIVGLAALDTASVDGMALPASQSSITLPLRQVADRGILPTHLLAVSTPDRPQKVVLVHGIVFVSQCTTPTLPQQRGAASESQDALALPIVRATLPSLPGFYALLAYMYLPRASTLLNALFPQALPSPLPLPLSGDGLSPAHVSPATRLHLATHLLAHAQEATTPTTTPPMPIGVAYLQNAATRVRDVSKTALALGMYRPELWDLLDFAWALVMCALGMALDSERGEDLDGWWWDGQPGGDGEEGMRVWVP
ncbi:hypothetical protein MKEN_00221100 [Mycena kentingensis (nom. inval.)]|nr:hypothetical protein MKEN_00221100 [Mycena kentingensis (nom. inval.)]